jgi:transcriptional regulator with XRE-family HTH domain
MSETQRLMQTLKQQLKLQGLTYRDVAATLAVSEASVKRLLNSGQLTLDRLLKLCERLGLTLAELTELAAARQDKLRVLSAAQEKELVSDPRLLLVTVCILNHWTLEELLAQYRLETAEAIGLLLRLERLGLMDVLPGNRIRLNVARDFDWRPDGPIRAWFRATGETDFLAHPFTGSGEVQWFSHAMLDQGRLAEVQQALHRLRQVLADCHQDSLSSPLAQRQGCGLLVALRPWEPAAFVELRR